MKWTKLHVGKFSIELIDLETFKGEGFRLILYSLLFVLLKIFLGC